MIQEMKTAKRCVICGEPDELGTCGDCNQDNVCVGCWQEQRCCGTAAKSVNEHEEAP